MSIPCVKEHCVKSFSFACFQSLGHLPSCNDESTVYCAHRSFILFLVLSWGTWIRIFTGLYEQITNELLRKYHKARVLAATGAPERRYCAWTGRGNLETDGKNVLLLCGSAVLNFGECFRSQINICAKKSCSLGKTDKFILVLLADPVLSRFSHQVAPSSQRSLSFRRTGFQRANTTRTVHLLHIKSVRSRVDLCIISFHLPSLPPLPSPPFPQPCCTPSIQTLSFHHNFV